MPSNETRVQVEALNSAISNFNNKKMSMENAYLKIYQAVGELGDTWIGASYTSFDTRFNEMYAKLKTISEQMDKSVDKIRTAISEYENAEDTAEAAINSLADDASVSYF